MTNKTATKKLAALRIEAEMHGDDRTVALVDAALAGDIGAAARLGIAAKAVKAVSTGAAAKAAPAARHQMMVTGDHPWSHDVE